MAVETYIGRHWLDLGIGSCQLHGLCFGLWGGAQSWGVTVGREHLGGDGGVEDAGLLVWRCWFRQQRYRTLALAMILQRSWRDGLDSQTLHSLSLSLWAGLDWGGL